MRRGFSLIEQLVVVAIIAILAAILFPVFATAREKGWQSSCLSNSKQIVLATLLYAQDYNEKLPVLQRLYSSRAKSVFEDLYPYVKSGETFHCPGGDSPKAGSRPMLETRSGPTKIKPSYGFRAESSGIGLKCVADPMTYPLTFDNGGPLELWSKEINPSPKDFVQPLFDDSTKVVGLPIQHDNGVNIGFADGHCKWWKTNTLYVGFGKKTELGSGQIMSKRQDPVRQERPATVENDVSIITLTAPLPESKRFILVHDGVVQFSNR